MQTICLNLTTQILLYKINTDTQQKQRNMQNQMQYTNNYNLHLLNNTLHQQKFNSPTHLKTFDTTLPTTHVKNYASNPNLSLELNGIKSSANMDEASNYSAGLNKKNNELRSPPPMQFGFVQKPGVPRPTRHSMTQSLVMGENSNNDLPEDNSNSKKDFLKNVPKKPYRLSEALTIDSISQALFKKQELGMLSSPKECKFVKKDSNEQKIENHRQIPSFLNRQRGPELKRSQVVEPNFESNRAHLARELTASKQMSWTSKPKPRKVIMDDFTRLKQLGNGKYGRVFLAKQKYTGFICALKVIEKKLLHEQQITDQFIREVKIQMFLNHPNIIKLYGCFDDAANIYIILQVGTGGQLYHQLKKSMPLSQPRIAFIMRQVCDAVNEIHSLKIIHRDIKPENIVLHDNIIKLCDFGWSVHQDNKLRTTFCGTPLYVCPQILKGKQYDEKIDIWSIGIMMYEMVVGENPFKITREEQLIKIVKDQIKMPSYLFVSTQVRDFLDRCLQKNPNDRATIKELVNHPFFKKIQQKTDKSKVINM